MQITGAASQSGNLLEFRNSASSVHSYFDKTGYLKINNGQTTTPTSGTGVLDVTSYSNNGAGGLAARFYAQDRSQYVGIDWQTISGTSGLNVYPGSTGDIFLGVDGSTISSGGVSIGTQRAAKINARFYVIGKTDQTSGNTGTVATTSGSNIVTGTGTNFVIQIGSAFTITIGANTYPVKSVDSNTQLTLYTPAVVSVSGQSWSFTTPTGYFGNNANAAYFAADSQGNFLSRSSGVPQIIVDKAGSRAWSISVDASNNNRILVSNVNNNTIPFYIDGNAPASSLIVNASGTLSPYQAVTASAPTYTIGAMYFDTTLNKLRVGGASGWETVTSV
jgi:hypothetical protein